jgi:hypothetical protein
MPSSGGGFPATANDSDSGVDLQHKFQNRSRVWGI